MRQGLRIVQVSRSHTHTHSAGFLWATDQSVAETSTWQHTTLTIDINAPVDIRTRNPPSERQQTHTLARPLKLASKILYHYVTPKNHNNRTSYTARRRDTALNSLLNDAVINGAMITTMKIGKYILSYSNVKCPHKIYRLKVKFWLTRVCQSTRASSNTFLSGRGSKDNNQFLLLRIKPCLSTLYWSSYRDTSKGQKIHKYRHIYHTTKRKLPSTLENPTAILSRHICTRHVLFVFEMT
jgi:hypothetical protein